jgi:predicted aspartyl protease
MKQHRILAASALVTVGATAFFSARATPPEYSPPRRTLEWIERYEYGDARVLDFEFGKGGTWVPVVIAKVAGRATPLILDTGTNGYASLDEQVIEELGLAVDDWQDFLDANGVPRGRIPIARVPTLELGSLRLEGVRVSGLGPESIMGPRRGFEGTLGWHALRGHRVTLDYFNRKAVLARSELPEGIVSCAERYVTRFVSPDDLVGLILVEGRLDGEKVYVEIDTGKSSTVLDPRTSDSHKFEHGKRGLEVGGITIGPFEVTTRFGRIGGGFGGFESGLDAPVHVGVGSDFLCQFLLTVDYATSTIVLEKKPCNP